MVKSMEYLVFVLGQLLLILVISILWQAFFFLIWRPLQITRFFARQGIHGPKYKFWSGSLDEIDSMKKVAANKEMNIDSHDIIARNLPHYTKWMSEYGGTFLYWVGKEAVLGITDLEQIKQVLTNKTGSFVKRKIIIPSVVDLIGTGLFAKEGSEWSRHRRIITPAFSMDNFKMMTKSLAQCTLLMLDAWKYQAVKSEGNQATIEVHKQFQQMLIDFSSNFTFGGNLTEGKEIFLAQKQIIALMRSMYCMNIPLLFKYLPTRSNVQRWKLVRKINNIITSIIQRHLNDEKVGYGNHLLGILMKANKKEEMKMDEIVGECNTLFFQGYETPSHQLSWTMFLLSTNPEWQEKLREEVLSECGTHVPNADNVTKLKQVRMVVLETLRLYPPANKIERKVVKDVTLGDLFIPKGMTVSLQTTMIQHSKEIWGDDVDEFNPLRFENGVSKASKHPNAMLAFGTGPRACVVQNFIILEMIMIVALILQRFSFTLSPDYKHMPTYLLGVEALKGYHIAFKSIDV